MKARDEIYEHIFQGIKQISEKKNMGTQRGQRGQKNKAIFNTLI
jgi:hypothetical protein